MQNLNNQLKKVHLVPKIPEYKPKYPEVRVTHGYGIDLAKIKKYNAEMERELVQAQN